MSVADECLCDILLDGISIGSEASMEWDQALAVADLIERNSFRLIGLVGGPYRLRIEAADGRLVLHIATNSRVHLISHYLSLTPYRRLLREYSDICNSYHEAMQSSGATKVQAIDMARRAIHNDAAELLKERLAARIAIDLETARRLFTLIHVIILPKNAYRLLVG